MLTYAQNFEDVMLARLFREQPTGFFIDIGAWHPVTHSVTKYFYDLGWHGINVEPIKRLYDLFQTQRARDVNLNAAVGHSTGLLRFYEVEDDTALSTVNPLQAEELRLGGRPIREYDVEVLTLQDIADRYCSGPVDFLKIDVEGWEAQVLEGVDWSKFRPRTLVIEAVKPASRINNLDNEAEYATWYQWEPMVLRNLYHFAYFDGLSRFYIRDEDHYLIRRLRFPPGVFDDIRFPEIQELFLKIEQTAQGATKAQFAAIEYLAGKLKEAESDRAARLETINCLAYKNTDLETRNAELDAALAKSEAKIAEIETDRAARLGLINRLSAQLNKLHNSFLPVPIKRLLIASLGRTKRLLLAVLWRWANGSGQNVSSATLPKISVVTPSFNSQDCIGQTIESVLSQEYPDLEYIIVDGGSTDGTLEIIRSYEKRGDFPQRISRIISEPDNGMYDAVAKGFEKATGEVLGYLNADDLYEPGALIQVGRTFAENSDVYVAYREDAVLVNGWKFPNVAQPPRVGFFALLLRRHILFQDGVFFRRSAYDAVGGLNRSLRLAGDFDLWLRLARRFRLRRFSGHVSCFRVRDGQLSANMNDYFREADQLVAAMWKTLGVGSIIRELASYAVDHLFNFLSRVWQPRRLFFPIDFANMPPPDAVSPSLNCSAPRCPITGEHPNRLLFSTWDNRFGGKELNYIYYCAGAHIAITYPSIEKSRLSRLYEENYSAPPIKDLVPPDPARGSPYRGFFDGQFWLKALFKIAMPDQVLSRFRIAWEDTTIGELLANLRSHRFNRNSKLRFLDVGCFEGVLLERLRVETSWTVFGLEPNTKAVKVARSKGVEVWHGAAEEAARIIPHEYVFDVIFMGQSIEHVDDPIGVIRQLRLLLAPGGIIVLSTPNLDSKQVQLFGPTSAIWHPPYHRHIFSRRSLTQLAARSGMRIAGVKSFSHPYWTAMSIQQNRFGLGGFVSHAVEFEPHICRAAQNVVFWSKLLWDWRGGGDYVYAVLAQ